jgi:hypothetical protein
MSRCAYAGTSSADTHSNRLDRESPMSRKIDYKWSKDGRHLIKWRGNMPASIDLRVDPKQDAPDVVTSTGDKLDARMLAIAALTHRGRFKPCETDPGCLHCKDCSANPNDCKCNKGA